MKKKLFLILALVGLTSLKAPRALSVNKEQSYSSDHDLKSNFNSLETVLIFFHQLQCALVEKSDDLMENISENNFFDNCVDIKNTMPFCNGKIEKAFEGLVELDLSLEERSSLVKLLNSSDYIIECISLLNIPAFDNFLTKFYLP